MARYSYCFVAGADGGAFSVALLIVAVCVCVCVCTVSPSSLVYIRDHIRINGDIRALLASISDRDSAELQSSFSRISGGFQEDFRRISNLIPTSGIVVLRCQFHQLKGQQIHADSRD